MRHGHSLANLAKIIVSHADHGVDGFGLSEQGVAEVNQSIAKQQQLPTSTLIFCSDFLRTRETAEIVAQYLGGNLGGNETPIPVARLRERHFGDLEFSPDNAYPSVWAEDTKSPDSEFCGVESANQVMARTTSMVSEIEKKYTNQTVLLVSHGDALQILQVAFHKLDASRHRQMDPLGTAEIRGLSLAD